MTAKAFGDSGRVGVGGPWWLSAMRARTQIDGETSVLPLGRYWQINDLRWTDSTPAQLAMFQLFSATCRTAITEWEVFCAFVFVARALCPARMMDGKRFFYCAGLNSV